MRLRRRILPCTVVTVGTDSARGTHMIGIDGVELRGPVTGRQEEILTHDAVAFVASLQRRFNGLRKVLLEARVERQARIEAGELPELLPHTREIRDSSWKTAPPPPDLADRRVEIMGPVDRKMVINALNSGARVFMADFEDANSPTWSNNLDGHVNLIDAIEGTIEFVGPDGRQSRRNRRTPTCLCRRRAGPLQEKQFLAAGRATPASLSTFASTRFT